VALIDRL